MSTRALIGTWALVASEWRRADGRHANPFGAGATGILTYDAGGYMSAQIVRADRPPPLPEAPLTIDAAMASGVPGIVAYFGTYEADEAAGLVGHHVIASAYPPWAGREQRRRYAFTGDRLTLSADLQTADGVAVAASTTWERVG